MSRFTYKDAIRVINEGIETENCPTNLCHYAETGCGDCEWRFALIMANEALEKLAHYEDLEEQGRLIELPCAVGDTVWVIDGVRWTGYDWKWKVYDEAYVREIKFNLDMLGDDFFLTKEEAEAKLKELEGVKE